jgi:hypothetical protein
MQFLASVSIRALIDKVKKTLILELCQGQNDETQEYSIHIIDYFYDDHLYGGHRW